MNSKIPRRPAGADQASEGEGPAPEPSVSDRSLRSALRLHQPSRPMASLSLLAVCGIVVATVLLTRRGAQPEPTAPPMTMTAIAAGLAAPPAGSASPNATPRLSTAAAFDIIVDSGRLTRSAWAPDSQHFAIALRADDIQANPAVQDVFDRSGAKVASVQADTLVWTGPATYRLGRSDATGTERFYAGELGSTVVSQVAGPLLDGSEFTPCVAQSYGNSYSLLIGGKPKSFEGALLACSADGSELLALHVTNDGMGVLGWLQVVDPDSGRILREWPDTLLASRSWVAFSPDGSAVAFDGTVDADPGGFSIAEISTGRIRTVFPDVFEYSSLTDGPIYPAWLPDDRLAIPDPVQHRVRAFGVDGAESSVSLPFDSQLSISKAGVVLAHDLYRDLTVQATDGTRSALHFPESPFTFDWSPDGLAAVVICTDGLGGVATLMVAH